MALLVMAIIAPFGGRLVDKQGAWAILLIGLGALATGCFLVAATASSLAFSLHSVVSRRSSNSPHFRFCSGVIFICGYTTSGVIETPFLPYASFCGFGPVPSATAYGPLSAINLVGLIGGMYKIFYVPANIRVC